MLKLFRTNRHQHIFGGRVKRYLLYAIGEIFLVVVGILIALQINNWNENRKDRIKEMEYLQRLKSDLQSDTIVLLTFQKIVKSKKAFLKAILTDDLQISRQDFGSINIKFIGTNLFSSRFQGLPPSLGNAFKEMTNSGKLDLLTNQTLKDEILVYYGLVDNRIDALENKLSDWPRIISQLIPGEGSFTKSSNPIEFDTAEVKSFLTTLSGQKETLRPFINAELQYTVVQESSFASLHQSADSLLIHLDQEISSRQ